MGPNRDEDSGQFTEQYVTADFLEAIADLETATTSQVAEEVGCSYDLAYRRLRKFADEGDVEYLEVGSSFIWKLPD